MKCPVCESNAPRRARFCPRCGGMLDPFLHTHPPPPAEDPSMTPPAPSSRIDSIHPRSEEARLPAGLVAGRYRLVREIGRGGFGVVYEAKDVEAGGRTVALKRILPARLSEPSVKSRFEEEARALSAMNHFGVVRFLNSGFFDGAPFLVTSYLQGNSLRDWILALKRRRSEEVLPATLPIVFQLAETLTYAHGTTAHMDLKPENIILKEDGTAVVLDFGLARIADFRAQGRRLLGTAYYVAPEIIAGDEVVPHRADVYSLGVIFFEMLRGELPVGMPAWPTQFLPGAPESLDRLLRRAMETDPVRRFRNMFAFRASLCAAFPMLRSPEEELSLARRNLAGAEPTAALWLAALLETSGKGQDAQEAYKIALREGRGTPVEEIARECLGYPRRKALRFCILCGVALPLGSRRSSLCHDCRKGRRKKPEPSVPSARKDEEAVLRGPRGGAILIRFSPEGREWLGVGDFGDAVVGRRSGTWVIAQRLDVPRGILDADFLGGSDRAILLAGREGAYSGRSKKPIVPIPGTGGGEEGGKPVEGSCPAPANAPQLPLGEEGNFEGSIHPCACCFIDPERVWIGDTRGGIREFTAKGDGDPVAREDLGDRILRICRLPTGTLLAVALNGNWVLREGGPLGPIARGSVPGRSCVRAAVASGVPVVAFLALGRLLLHRLPDSGEPEHLPISSRVHSLAVHPRGDVVAVGDDRGTVHLLGSGSETKRRFQLDRNIVSALEFSPDGSWLAASTLGGGIWMIRLTGSA